jgi:FKBP-type peptidyl-prolyl cis-trans isomerase SlyD
MADVKAWFIGVALVLAGSLLGAPVRAESGLQVADGLKVTIEYTLTLPDKTVADSNVGQAPFAYTQGAHEIVPGLEKALVGMKAGQKKRIDVPAIEAYGASNPKLRETVEKSKVPPDVKVGSILRTPDGRIMVKVLEVTDKTVVVDHNHPLAGKNLVFDVKVLNVEKQEQKPAPGKKP